MIVCYTWAETRLLTKAEEKKSRRRCRNGNLVEVFSIFLRRDNKITRYVLQASTNSHGLGLLVCFTGVMCYSLSVVRLFDLVLHFHFTVGRLFSLGCDISLMNML